MLNSYFKNVIDKRYDNNLFRYFKTHRLILYTLNKLVHCGDYIGMVRYGNLFNHDESSTAISNNSIQISN